MTDIERTPKHHSDSARPGPLHSTEAPLHDRVFELLALVSLLGIASLVYVVAGPAAFSAVVSAGVGLFATWRARR
ncbi:hypothetical protein ACWD5R_44800 [Streptomyces sp. NPDC002514]|uniref:hypothetical protein n=1 Tax=Streptomyces sp. NPDC001270 TaxID=3364554 RepID=UPI0036BA476B